MRLAESVCAAAFVATLVACDKPTDPPFGDPAATATAPVNATATADGSATPTTAAAPRSVRFVRAKSVVAMACR